MGTWLRGWTALLAVAVSSWTAAQAEEVAGKDPVPPFRGKVTGSNVNIRMSPGREGTIIRVAREGESLLVVGKEVGWYRIAPPENAWVWISAAAVKKTEGDTLVTRDTALRIDSRMNAPEVGKIEKGAPVKILAEKPDWYKIQAPRSVSMYIHDEYVAFERAYDPKTDGEIEAVAAAVAGGVKGGDTKGGTPKTGDQVKPVEPKGPTPDEKLAQRDAELRRLKEQYDLIQKEHDLKVKKIIADTQKKDQKVYDITGFVDTVGLYLDRPAPYALVNGGKIVCYVKSADPTRVKLHEYYGQLVGVRGKSEAVRGQEPLQIFTVDLIEKIVKD
jgi:uncharacterized protein YgiM (DUF1202 family)